MKAKYSNPYSEFVLHFSHPVSAHTLLAFPAGTENHDCYRYDLLASTSFLSVTATQQTSIYLVKKHVWPWGQNRELFLSLDNLLLMCKSWHWGILLEKFENVFEECKCISGAVWEILSEEEHSSVVVSDTWHFNY